MEDKLENSNDFNDILVLKYYRYSYVLRKNYDFVSALHFSRLGLEAHKRKSRFSLKTDESLKYLEPETLADMYFTFNCWMYFETNNKNLGEAAICKNSFVKLTNLLEKQKNIALTDKIIELEGKKTKFSTKDEEVFYLEFTKNKVIDIFFDFDNYKLNQESLVKISSVLKYVNELKTDYKINIIGHTDRVGKAVYNNTLARRRVNTVYNVLIKNGIPKDLISFESLSSKSPKIITKQQEKNQLNRRVEITISTNFSGQDLEPQPLKL
jgi:outer membrane protein OmpA-like peptidoglycan-associated protein